jgi:hypothetical protein
MPDDLGKDIKQTVIMETSERDSNIILSYFIPFNGLEIRKVWYLWADKCLDKIILSFDTDSLMFEAQSEYDSIRISSVPKSHIVEILDSAVSASPTWSKFIGKRFGWGWIAINQQNVLDGVALSFNGIFPNVFLNVAASSIRVHEVLDVKQEDLNEMA